MPTPTVLPTARRVPVSQQRRRAPLHVLTAEILRRAPDEMVTIRAVLMVILDRLDAMDAMKHLSDHL
jgi:hypothetical protein